jgi:hypothetical protein
VVALEDFEDRPAIDLDWEYVPRSVSPTSIAAGFSQGFTQLKQSYADVVNTNL